jgi:UDP-glucose 4-epimerase
MMQFIHEEDLAEAIARTLETGVRGVFNVVGPGAVPLKVAIRETGGMAVPLPEIGARAVIDRLFRVGLYHLPSAALDFVKYPCTIDWRRFQQATKFKPLFSLEDTFSSVRH